LTRHQTIHYHLHKQAEASLNAGVDLREAVKKPPDEELNDWIAVHVVDFYNRINLIYGTICDRCTDETCPRMTGGKKFEYHWRDDNRYRKPTPMPAPLYISLLMDWIEEQINNPDIFPTSVDVPFPKNYLSVVKKIMSRLYRVFVHVYIHHFDRLVEISAEAHVNICYKHFYYFVTYFDLIDPKELAPLVGRPNFIHFLEFFCKIGIRFHFAAVPTYSV
uniref:MOB kinase activator-like 3 n=1 Tax=Taenia asiatica TaxID=60517 RepID=A0A0R3W955_TAEAS